MAPMAKAFRGILNILLIGPLQCRPLSDQFTSARRLASQSSKDVEKMVQISRSAVASAVHAWKFHEPGSFVDVQDRRLSTTTCEWSKALEALAGNGCGSSLVIPLLSTDAQFTSFCIDGCAAKLQDLVKTWVQKPECKAKRSTIRLMGHYCSKGSFGGETGYCMASKFYSKFTGSVQSLTTTWDPNFNTAPYCAADGCFPKLLAAIVDGMTSTDKLIWEIVEKAMCMKPPGATSTCWKTFAGMLKGTINVMNEFLVTPKTFCGDKCKTGVTMDFARIAAAQDPSQKGLEAQMKALVSFGCLKKEDGTHCISSVAHRTEAADNVFNWDGKKVTAPVCKKTGDDEDDGDDTWRCPANDKCGPWCKQAKYQCDAKLGICEDFTNCSAKTGYFAEKPCTCNGLLAQITSLHGCCMAAMVDFTCDTIAAGQKIDETTVDKSMCGIDAAASKERGFDVTKALVRAETCGIKLDPRCTHGKTMKTVAFFLTLTNVDTEATCKAPEKPAAELKSVMATNLGAAERDVSIELCPTGGSGRRLSNSLSPQVIVVESGATDLALVKDNLKTVIDTGKLLTDIEDKVTLASTGGKSMTLDKVGDNSEGTKAGVKGSTIEELQKVQEGKAVAGTTSAAHQAALISLSDIVKLAIPIFAVMQLF